MSRGRFIAFEGGEGCGKSTQAARLASHLGARLTREPGGTVVGEHIRALVLATETEALDPRAEALLVAAARAQHVAEVIAPSLAAGSDVVSDRFTGSSLAYQGFGRGLDVDEVAALSDFATVGVAPDVVVLVEVPPEVAATRVDHRRPDRFEAELGGFHDRVRAGYRALAAADDRWVVVDGTGTVEEVAARVTTAVAGRLLSAW